MRPTPDQQRFLNQRRRDGLLRGLFPAYSPDVPEADRRMGDWCELAAVVTILLMVFAVGTWF